MKRMTSATPQRPEDRVVIDPETGWSTTCGALRDATHQCFRDFYANRKPLDINDPNCDPQAAREPLKKCYRRAQVVLRQCHLPVAIGAGMRPL